MRERGALVDRALVGELARVERGRIVHQNDAGEAAGAAARGPIEGGEQVLDFSRTPALAANSRAGTASSARRLSS